MDLAKAFDTVNHDLLLQKLNRIGIRGKANDLIESYLTNRKQVVRINQTTSEEMKVTCGVPQGTILGPLLFILYMNDIFKITSKNEIIAFADDTAVIVIGESWLAVLSEAERIINRIACWLSDNFLSLNISKTNFMTHGSYRNSVPDSCSIKIHNDYCDLVNCDCTKLTRVTHSKYLGIMIDENLKWLDHVNYLVRSLRYLLFIFYKLKHILSTNQLLILYYALFWSRATYGLLVWGGTHDTTLKLLHNLHKRLLKIIYKKNMYYSSEILFRESNLLNLRKCFAEKSVLKNFVILRDKYLLLLERNTRQKYLRAPTIFKEIGRRNHKFFSHKLFDIIPHEIKIMPPKQIINKKLLRNWLLLLRNHTIEHLLRPLL